MKKRKLQRENGEKITKAKSLRRRVGITGHREGLGWAFIVVGMKADRWYWSYYVAGLF